MTLLLLVLVVALAFEFINGFHDTANSIAAVVGYASPHPHPGHHAGGLHQSDRRAGGNGGGNHDRQGVGGCPFCDDPPPWVARSQEALAGICSPGGWDCLRVPAMR